MTDERLPFPDGWQMHETAHYNGGKEWFGYGSRCIQEPRLSVIDRYYRKDRSVVRTWQVDGRDCPDADAAWAALQKPPEFTEEEIAALRLAPTVPTDLRKVMSYQTFFFLQAKGAVTGGMMACCITDAGRAAITKATQA